MLIVRRLPSANTDKQTTPEQRQSLLGGLLIMRRRGRSVAPESRDQTPLYRVNDAPLMLGYAHPPAAWQAKRCYVINICATESRFRCLCGCSH